MDKPALRAVDPNEKFDPWAVEEDRLTGGNYDPDKRYCRASTDGKNTKENISVGFSPEIIGALRNLAWSQVFPEYRSAQDIIRNAVIHQLHKDNATVRDEGLERIVVNEVRLAEAELAEREMEAADGAVAADERIMARAHKAGDVRRLQQYVRMARDHAMGMDDPHRGQLLAIVDEYEARL